MMFQQCVFTRSARIAGGLAALSLLLVTAGCDQADPLSPASAQSAEIIRGGEAVTPLGGSGFGTLGDPGLSNVTQHQTVATGSYATALGIRTKATGQYSTALGNNSEARGDNSVAAGFFNVAAGPYSTAFGYRTQANGNNAFALGWETRANGTWSMTTGRFTVADGVNATAMGRSTLASGDFSTAMGYYASTDSRAGAFVYGDASTNSRVQASRANQFAVRAQHFWLGHNNAVANPAGQFISTSTGAFLTYGGTWTNSSDVALKDGFEMVDQESILEKIANLPIQRWSYRAEDPSVRHIGPTAQDFYAAFGLGHSDKSIATVDADGIALLAIQALERRNAELRQTVERHEQELDRLNQRLDALERAFMDRNR